ncbi:hypothetical protein HEP73_02139 [Xanthomonas sp. GW]|uniref:phage regulatory CII family protein n=1 Tax=Xanthomonas sp. GW TaxID=2724121 RepID=UPI00163AC982|nr:phage regulatory CII family protein [Xanthomonas sp. GW]QNH21227.1 hypothetical protein HEP73_02139 [Xanthomonas sp. GW]
MNVSDAAYYTVHDYPGGAGPLGLRLTRINKDGEEVGMSEAVLNSKVNQNTTTHQLGLLEADRIMGLTGDHRILFAMASNHGYQLHKLNADPAHGTLMQRLLKASSAEGAVDRVLEEALSDGVITPNELKAVISAEMDRQAASMQLMAKLREMCEARAAA